MRSFGVSQKSHDIALRNFNALPTTRYAKFKVEGPGSFGSELEGEEVATVTIGRLIGILVSDDSL